MNEWWTTFFDRDYLYLWSNFFTADQTERQVDGYWSGPKGSGEKKASFRIYNANEIVRLMEQAGLELISAHRGCSAELFQASGTDMGGRLGLLSKRK